MNYHTIPIRSFRATVQNYSGLSRVGIPRVSALIKTQDTDRQLILVIERSRSSKDRKRNPFDGLKKRFGAETEARDQQSNPIIRKNRYL